MTTMQGIQDFYEKSYKDAKDEMEPNEVHIGVTANGVEKTFVEKNFYMCGFNYINFKGTGKNRELIPFSRKNYGGGFRLVLNKIGNGGNGDYEIQQKAFNRTADYIDSLGYSVYAESRLD